MSGRSATWTRHVKETSLNRGPVRTQRMRRSQPPTRLGKSAPGKGHSKDKAPGQKQSGVFEERKGSSAESSEGAWGGEAPASHGEELGLKWDTLEMLK